jgi:hypothetical protein
MGKPSNWRSNSTRVRTPSNIIAILINILSPIDLIPFNFRPRSVIQVLNLPIFSLMRVAQGGEEPSFFFSFGGFEKLHFSFEFSLLLGS